MDLVTDLSVQVDLARSENALQANMEFEYKGTERGLLSLNWDQLLFVICLLFLQVLVLFTR